MQGKERGGRKPYSLECRDRKIDVALSERYTRVCMLAVRCAACDDCVATARQKGGGAGQLSAPARRALWRASWLLTALDQYYLMMRMLEWRL